MHDIFIKIKTVLQNLGQMAVQDDIFSKCVKIFTHSSNMIGCTLWVHY